MVDRFRALLDEPLEPRVGRAVVAFASAIMLGFAALFVLAASEPEGARVAEPSPVHSEAPATAPDPAPARSEPVPPPRRRQDPQDQEGSAASRRAERALGSRRALQHVPYRSGRLTVELVGARGNRAVLRIGASTVRAAREGWHRFLRRYHDSGRAYVPVFSSAARRSATRNGL